jgi:hypothetical protein
MYTINPIPGQIAQPPALPPQTVWRRRIAPTVGPFVFSVPLADFDEQFCNGRPVEAGFATEVKTVLEDGDEFVANTTDGGVIKLTVGQVISWGGTP